MSTENNPYLTVPGYDQLNQNFGKEKLYSGYTAPSAVSDLAAAAAASNLQTGARTPDKGKYIYDSKTGQYIWVPATAAAAVSTGVSASPYYQNQNQERLMPGRGDTSPTEQARIDAFLDAETAKDVALQTQENAESGDRFAPVPSKFTQGERIKKDLDILSIFDPTKSPIFKGLQALFSKQSPSSVTVEDRTPVSVNTNDGGTTGRSIADMAEAEGVALGPQATGVGAGKPGETAVGGSGYGFGREGGDSVGGGYGGNDGSGEGFGGIYARGGRIHMAGGGLGDLGGYSDGGRLLRGPGDGVSDSIPASIGNKRPARLADGEFVIPARIVSELGNGSTDAGARKLYAMLDRIQAGRKKTVGKGKVATNSRSDKNLPA